MTTDELESWAAEFAAFHDRLADLFARAEPRAQVAKYLRGLLSCGERKNGWHLAELMGDATPDRMQRLLYQADWDADAVRDALCPYVIQHVGDPHGVLVLDETVTFSMLAGTAIILAGTALTSGVWPRAGRHASRAS